jgi:TonB family protein
MKFGAVLASVLCTWLVLITGEKASASVFCEADIATILPWDVSTGTPDLGTQTGRYAIVLFANDAARLSGNIIVLTDNRAYDVPFTGVGASKSPDFADQYVSDAFFAVVPKSETIRFAWVDEVGMNGSPARTCPTDPFDPRNGPVGPFRLPGTPAAQREALTVPAAFKMNLPVTDCAVPYSGPKLIKQAEKETQAFDTSQGLKANLGLKVFLDSDGKVADVRITRSSGSAAIDTAAKVTVSKSQYAPAIFRCVPVVSTVDIDFDYEVQP